MKFSPIGGIQSLFIDDFQFHRDSAYSIKKMAKIFPDKKILLVNRTINPVIGLLDPFLINEVLQNPQNYRKLKADFISHNILGQGIFFSDHQKWKQQRKLIAHNFAFQEIKKYIPIFDSSAEKYVKRLNQQANGKSPIPIITMCRKITSQVILGSFFGYDIDKKRVNDKPASQEVSDLMQDSIQLNSQSVYMKIKRIILGETLQFTKFARCERENQLFERLNNLREAIKQVVQIRIDKYKDSDIKQINGDILDIYVKCYLEGNCDIDEIVNQSINFFFVGQEPIGTTIALALYYIAKNKNVQNRLRLDMQNTQMKLKKSQSANEKVINQNYPIQQEQNKEQQNQEQEGKTWHVEQGISQDLINLEYLQAVLNETLRIQSPANMLVYRVAEKDHLLGGKFPVKKGWVLNTYMQAVNHNPKYFHNSNEFIPERWLGKEKEHIDKNIFTPFSGGPRNCLGQYFAQIEAKIIILHFMKNFKLIENEDVQLVMNQYWIYSPVKENLIKLEKIIDNNQKKDKEESLNLPKKLQKHLSTDDDLAL